MDLKNKEYTSTELFPFFQNRLIPERRPEYYTMLSWLDMNAGENDPLDILSASGGSKKTDNFRIVKVPERTDTGEYRLKFFVSGIAYISDEAKTEIISFNNTTTLNCDIEPSNKSDTNAIALISPNTMRQIGYYPRYLNEDLIKLNKIAGVAKNDPLITNIKVIKVNFSAPEQYRLLCESVTPWPDNFEPFQSEKYQLILTNS